MRGSGGDGARRVALEGAGSRGEATAAAGHAGAVVEARLLAQQAEGGAGVGDDGGGAHGAGAHGAGAVFVARPRVEVGALLGDDWGHLGGG